MRDREPSTAKFERPGYKVRVALLIAFGGLLGLLLAAGLQSLSLLDSAHSAEQIGRTDFLARNQCVMNVGSRLAVYSELVQQTPPAASGLAQLSSQIHAALQNYPSPRQAQEQVLLNKLQSTLADEDRTMHVLVSRGRPVWVGMAPGHFRVIAATQEVATWNNDQFRNMDAALLSRFTSLRATLKRLLMVLLGSGLLLAIGSIVFIAAQEREMRQRYLELAESRDAQAQLSSRLLDAQEQERRSISRELHDEVGQSLGALLVDVGQVSALLPPEESRLREHVRNIKAAAERSVASVRNIALLLRPSMLDDLGLVAAIEWQAREVSRRSDLEAEVHSTGISDDLSEERKICIYRVTQEALNNAARHSGGRHATVNLRQEAGAIHLEIRDDGHGFDPQRSRGVGLLGMEERVRLLRGKLRIDSKLGEGTTVSAELPVA